MKITRAYHLTLGLLLFIPIISIGLKIYLTRPTIESIIPKEIYSVKFQFDIPKLQDKSYIKAYIPGNNLRQSVYSDNESVDSIYFNTEEHDAGIVGKWDLEKKQDLVFDYKFIFEGKTLKYEIPESMKISESHSGELLAYLQAEEHIQSDHFEIKTVADQLKQDNLLNTLKSNFDFVSSVESTNSRLLTDALTTLRLQRASCNGKSRLLTALCRAQGIPARVAGGLILDNNTKRTSHSWTEVLVNDNWVPFDALNNHFALIPSNYLELYKGDEFVIMHSRDLAFDYQFASKRIHRNTHKTFGYFHLWFLFDRFDISMNLLRTILLLPLAALLIAILRNVIGIKTFGILLPALIGLSLLKTQLIWGLFAFLFVIVVVACLHRLMDGWTLLHIPKLVIILTAVIISLLSLVIVSDMADFEFAHYIIYVPLVVLSITAERFAKVLLDESFEEAKMLILNTFAVALMCYMIFKSNILLGLLLSFPELYLLLLGVLLLLGRWIGMRVSEYIRFAPIAQP